MKIEATYTFDFTDESKLEVQEFFKVMREYTLVILKLEHMKGKLLPIPEHMGQDYLLLRVKVHKALLKCFADNPVELDNLTWDSSKFVSREEQAVLFAPQG